MPGVVEFDDKALLGALVVFKKLDKDIQKEVNRAAKSKLEPLWAKLIRNKSITRQDESVIGAGKASFTASGKGSLTAAKRGKPLSGGLVPNTNWPWVEFGSAKAHGRTGQLPRFKMPKGRVAYESAARFGPAAARVYLGVIYDAFRKTGVTEDG